MIVATSTEASSAPGNWWFSAYLCFADLLEQLPSAYAQKGRQHYASPLLALLWLRRASENGGGLCDDHAGQWEGRHKHLHLRHDDGRPGGLRRLVSQSRGQPCSDGVNGRVLAPDLHCLGRPV